jgi:hypothetical protein
MTSAFSHPTNEVEASNLFLMLASKVHSIKEKHTPGKSPVPDARRMGLMNCYQFITSNLFIMNFVTKVAHGQISGDEFRRIVNLESGDIGKALSDIFTTAKMNLLPLVQFQIENMLRNILVHIDPTTNLKGYYKICKTLLDRVSISNKADKLVSLQIPAYIRNSLHSNGVHENEFHSPSVSYFIQGVEFKFEHEKNINCAGTGHIYLALDNAFDVVDEMLGTSEIKLITTEIRDKFAWANKGIP